MELPDIKKEAHEHINSLEGTVLGCVQIMVDDKGHVATCIGGIPDVIVRILAKAMQKNHQIKDLFESAWCEANSSDFNPELN